MAIIQGNAKQGSTRGFYPKVINGSLRFNDDDSAYLSWTPASAGNRKTWTWSGWVKRCTLGGSNINRIITAYQDDDNFTDIRFANDDTINFRQKTGNVEKANYSTLAVFRDPSAWYHIVVIVDTTDATAADRYKIYVNGVQQSLSTTTTYPQNQDTFFSHTSSDHAIGAALENAGAARHFDGYMADVHFIDGQALTASDFGETKNGVWVAKDYAGTFGTNGFYLTFEDDTQVEAFNTVLYRGNGGTQSITGVGFQPDLLWIKNRNGTQVHQIFDAVRGVAGSLRSNATDAENIDSPNDRLLSFDSDGFSLGDDGNPNGSGNTYVAWCWKAGDSNVSNTDGTITSTVRANDTYGFSIVSYTGNATQSTIGHGLSSAPDFLVIKNRDDGSSNWIAWHSSLSTDRSLYLNLTGAENTNAPYFFGDTVNMTVPTNSVFTVGANSQVNSSGNDIIAYCWSETTGYSKFGSYTSNGSTDGPEVTCGFAPAMVLVKNTTTGATNWVMYDNTRDVDGEVEKYLLPNSSNAEASHGGGQHIKFLSNGFKIATSSGDVNPSGGDTYIYAAFADTREAAFWLDQSGNDNDWQPVNLDHNDTVADSPTNNFATLNPLNKAPRHVLSDGNLNVNGSVGNQYNTSLANFSVTSGKYYWEINIIDGDNNTVWVGVANSDSTSTSGTTLATALQVAKNWHLYGYNGTMYLDGVADTTFTGTLTFGTGDHMMIAADADTGKVWIGKNGTWFNSGNPTAGTGEMFTATGDITPIWGSYKVQHKAVINFGQQPFKYDPPA